MVIQSEPFLPRKELIVVPQQVVLGFMTSLHLRLNHPTENQLVQVFQRGFYALKTQHFAKITLQNCDLCQSLKVLPKELHQQSTVDIPVTPCKSFAADVIRRYRQKIFVLRDTFTSFTCAELIPSEDANVLRSMLCKFISSLRPSPQTTVYTRADNASGFRALAGDTTLSKGVTKIYGKTPREMGIFWSLKISLPPQFKSLENLLAPPFSMVTKSSCPPSSSY